MKCRLVFPPDGAWRPPGVCDFAVDDWTMGGGRSPSGLILPREPRIIRPGMCDLVGFDDMMGAQLDALVGIKMWGSGGGNRGGYLGGASAYVSYSDILPVGSILWIAVGGRGISGAGASGGGFSGVFLNGMSIADALCIAGSGGGAAGGANGGDAGALQGARGEADGSGQSDPYGWGGSQTVGGAWGGGLMQGGQSDYGAVTASGGWPNGGNGRETPGNNSNGGGGAGYYGGGSGNIGGVGSRAGGGGSSYVKDPNKGSAWSASGHAAANYSDFDRENSYGDPAQDGVVLIWVNGVKHKFTFTGGWQSLVL